MINLDLGLVQVCLDFQTYRARDTGWSLRGYLSLGEYDFAFQVIENFLKHQAKSNSKQALKGELPMIISGKYFLHRRHTDPQIPLSCFLGQ